MPLLQCPTCRQPFQVADAFLGYAVACPFCRHVTGMPASLPPPPAPEPFGFEADEPAPARARYERGQTGQAGCLRAAVWGMALVPTLFVVGLVMACLFRVIPGGISDMGIVAAAAMVVTIMAVAFAVDRMLSG